MSGPDLADLDMRIRARLDGIREAAKYQKPIYIPESRPAFVVCTMPLTTAKFGSDATNWNVVTVCVAVIALCIAILWVKRQQKRRQNYIDHLMVQRVRRMHKNQRHLSLQRPKNFSLEE